MHKKLLYLFPDYKYGDWEIIDFRDGRGPQIAKWNRPEPQPSTKTLDAVTDEQADDARLDADATAAIENSKALKAIIRAVANNLPGKSGDAFMKEVRDIFKAL